MKVKNLVVGSILAMMVIGTSAAYVDGKTGGPGPVAMKADEGVPQNLVTAMKADEGVPQDMVTRKTDGVG